MSTLARAIAAAIALSACAARTAAQAPQSRGPLTVYDPGRHLTWLMDGNAPVSMGVIGYDPGTQSAIPTPRFGLLTKDEAVGFAAYFNTQSPIPGREWRLPESAEVCGATNLLSELFVALGNQPASPTASTSFEVTVGVRQAGYIPAGQVIMQNSPTEYRANATWAEMLTMLDDPLVEEIDASTEPYLGNRHPFVGLSSSAPYWLATDDPSSPTVSFAFWFFHGGLLRSDRALRRHVILVHEGDVYQAATAHAVRPDADGDGLADDIDADPASMSTAFGDLTLGGTVTGTIVDRGGQRLGAWSEVFSGTRVVIVRTAAIPIGSSYIDFPSGLQRRSPRVVYDADQDLTWTLDANVPLSMAYNSAAGTTFPSGGRLTFDEAAGCGEELGYGPCINPPAALANSDHLLDYINATNALDCGAGSWRLPRPDVLSCNEGFGCTTDELGHLYHVLLGNPQGTSGGGPVLANRGPFLNVEAQPYWTGQDLFSPNSDERFVFNFAHGMFTTQPRNYPGYVWLVHDGDVAGPAPATLRFCSNDVEVTMWRWEAVAVYCGSAHIRSVRGRPLVTLLDDGTPVGRVRLPADHGLVFEPDEGAVRADAGNAMPLVVHGDGRLVRVDPGGTAELGSERPTWLIVLVLLAVVILLVWLVLRWLGVV